MKLSEAMQLARAEYRRGIMDGMGINLIAEAWNIPRYQVERHGDAYGLMSEPYLLKAMAKQIMEMDLGSNTVASEVCELQFNAREDVGNLGGTRQRQAGLR